MSTPAVSVVMAVHNRADYLPEAIASIRWQTRQDWELVCVDDGSTDATPDVLAAFAARDPRIRVLRQDKAGVAAALTRGDAAARADWIARMDSDDVALPDRLEKQLDAVRARPGLVGLGGAVLLTDPAGAPIGPYRYATDHAEIQRRLLAGRGDTIAHPTLLYRRAVLDRIGAYRHEYEAAHDADFLVRLAGAGEVANLPDTLLLYRQHPGNFCRERHAEIRQQMHGLLREAHAERGLPFPPELEAALTRPAKQSPLAGKWARRAARNGYAATAWRLWREQAGRSPASFSASFYTARVGVEVLLRSAIALATGRRGERLDLPDWREWDCPGASGASQHAA